MKKITLLALLYAAAFSCVPVRAGHSVKDNEENIGKKETLKEFMGMSKNRKEKLSVEEYQRLNMLQRVGEIIAKIETKKLFSNVGTSSSHSYCFNSNCNEITDEVKNILPTTPTTNTDPSLQEFFNDVAQFKKSIDKGIEPNISFFDDGTLQQNSDFFINESGCTTPKKKSSNAQQSPDISFRGFDQETLHLLQRDGVSTVFSNPLTPNQPTSTTTPSQNNPRRVWGRAIITMSTRHRAQTQLSFRAKSKGKELLR